MKNILISLVTFYQKVLSPDHSFWAKAIFPNGYCKFYPTCSAYSKEALKKESLMTALLLSIKRVIKCTPWSKGGFNYLNIK